MRMDLFAIVMRAVYARTAGEHQYHQREGTRLYGFDAYMAERDRIYAGRNR